jgi:transposase-like protein
MSQYQITLDEALLQRLFQNDGLKALLETLLNQVLQTQASDQLQATPYERTQERQGYRNGYRERSLTTRIGTLTLQVPKLRQGSFTPDLYERWQRSEQALLACMVEMVIQGVSTRKVSAVVEELCGTEISKSSVSALCQRLDPQVSAWRERDLKEATYPFVLVDALVIRVRIDGRVRQRSLLLATGVNREGYRQLLGLSLGDKESQDSWGAFFTALKQRGLSGVDLIVSDSHSGLVNAIHTHFQAAVWQRCQTHLCRNVLAACPETAQESLHKALRRLFEADTPQAARQELSKILSVFQTSAPKACDCLEAAFEDATAVLALPERYRKRLRTTNSQERLNEEIRRRERVIRIFPNEASAERLMGALLMEFDEAFSTGHRYFEMTDYWLWKQQQPAVEVQQQAA